MKLIDGFNNIEQHLEGLDISRVDDSYSEEDLIKIEEEYGIEFPDIYKLFVLKYGNSTIFITALYNNLGGQILMG
ncbi:hypothetical protein AMS62_05430 [Bacillus sp. FJAT-18019]|nr:hypothetical protein AMS62_05430 [Bacillus sp. FJAT-18019]